MKNLNNMFKPESVAVIGASNTPGKVGYIIVDNLINDGFEGKIYPVNPKGGEILGKQAYKNIKDIPEKVDFFQELPAYETDLFTNKKSKTNLENSLTSLQTVLPVLENLETWTNEALYETLVALAAEQGVKNAILLWPLRVAVSGKASTPVVRQSCVRCSGKKNPWQEFAMESSFLAADMKITHCDITSQCVFFMKE